MIQNNDQQDLVFEYNYLNLERPQIVYHQYHQNLPHRDTRDTQVELLS